MSVKSVEHGGFTIRAAAFEVGDSGRFMSSLTVGRTGSAEGNLIDLPMTDGLFDTAEDALEDAIAHARRVIDCVGADFGGNNRGAASN